jgi:DNA-binding CsgD family transcriptional regulator
MSRKSLTAVKKKSTKPVRSGGKNLAIPLEEMFAKRTLDLTDRERDVLKFFARGHTYQEIGEKLEISPKTVGSYLQRVREKARAKTRSDLITLAFKENLVSAEKK